MDLQTVIANLNNTIAGKEHMLVGAKGLYEKASTEEGRVVLFATMKFLEINIEELKRIRDDLLEIK